MFPTRLVYECSFDAVFLEKNVPATVRQAISDDLSALKPQARDTLFNALGYRHLQSTFVVHYEMN